MQKNITPRLIPARLAIAFSGAASAAGFQLLLPRMPAFSITIRLP